MSLEGEIERKEREKREGDWSLIESEEQEEVCRSSSEGKKGLEYLGAEERGRDCASTLCTCYNVVYLWKMNKQNRGWFARDRIPFPDI